MTKKPAPGKVTKDDLTKKFISNNTMMCELALERMSTDMMRYSKAWVPRKTGELQQTAEVEHAGELEWIVWYDRYGDLGYAPAQEVGTTRGYPIRNYTTPGTGSHYLKRAGEKVQSNALNYLRQAAKRTEEMTK